jgi:type VI secretion system protein ImpM
MMPSVDKVGRYFPLSLCACASEATGIDPPILDPLDDWYEPVEQALLRALDEDFDDEPDRLIEGLPFPRIVDGSAEQRDVASADCSIWMTEGGSDAFRSALLDDLRSLCSQRSYWWTAGGKDHPAQLVACRQMPDPCAFDGFLTGRFASEPRA